MGRRCRCCGSLKGGWGRSVDRVVDIVSDERVIIVNVGISSVTVVVISVISGVIIGGRIAIITVFVGVENIVVIVVVIIIVIVNIVIIRMAIIIVIVNIAGSIIVINVIIVVDEIAIVIIRTITMGMFIIIVTI